jgi:glycosyl transferase family 1
VCNSHQAAREWGFARHRVIWHGLDPQEFPPGTHQAGVVGHGFDPVRPHYRGGHEFRRVAALLMPGVAVATHEHPGVCGISPSDRRYAELSFRAWVDHLRRFKVYLNTTLRSPMPRSRTEAMMCGVVPVSLRNHDVDRFVVQGENGFYGDSPEELAGYISFLLGNEAARADIAREARATALLVFNHDRFLSDWTAMLQELGF